MHIIRGISYRHIAGYLKVVGSTRQAAEDTALKVEAALKNRLPLGTIVKSGRYRGIQDQLHTIEVPVILNRPGVRRILAVFALQGDVEKLSA